MLNRIVLTVALAAVFGLAHLAGPGAAANPVAPAGVSARQADAPTRSLEELYDEGTRVLFRARPTSAANYGLSEEQVGMHYADRIEDYSPAAEAALRSALRDLSRQIADWPVPPADEAEAINREIMANVTRYYAGNEDFPIGYIDVWMGLSPFIVSQINGPLIDIPRNMNDNQRVETLADAVDYLVKLSQFDRMVDSVLARLAADADRNWIPPAVVVKGALAYIERFIAPPPAEHSLVSSFADKLTAAGVAGPDREALVERAAGTVDAVVYPAYRRAAAALRELLPRARKEAGIWAQPRGAEYYRDAVRFLGDSDLDPQKIHEIGLSEIERISAEMDRILRAEGYVEGSVGERMVALSTEDRFLYEDSAAGREALISDLNAEIDRITQLMRPWFRTAPPYEVEVRAYPPEIEDGMPGGEYQSPSLDGSKPGIYYINLRDMQGAAKHTLKTLTYHEANPGHHWQVALNLAQSELPFLRRLSPYNAYTEGWALYAEQVAAELGAYENDPFGNLGRLQDELFRAVRLAVDTGLHHKRWTREQAIEFMAEATGKAPSEVVAEVERYMTWPGQALGYKLGMLQILGLRERAMAALGDDFDIAAFHDLLLLEGAMPMSVLQQRVDRWIAEQTAD